MKYYSEKLNKVFNTIEALEDAEAKKKAEEDAAALKKSQEAQAAKIKNEKRAADARELDQLYKAYVAARKTYNDKMTDFIKRWGSYHYTVTEPTEERFPLLDELFESLFDKYLK